MIFQCYLCGCALYNPFKSYCEECNKIRRIMLLNDKINFVNKVESIFLNKQVEQVKSVELVKPVEISKPVEENKEYTLKKSKTTEDLQALNKPMCNKTN